jgi:hypothetical protein
MHFLHTA